MKKEIIIQNLKCDGCATTITKELKKIVAVEDVAVNFENNSVLVELTGENISDVIKRLDQLGYPAVDEDNNLLKKAKSYVSCAIGRVQKD